MTNLIEQVVAIFLILTGLSYLFQSFWWKRLIQELVKQPTLIMLWSLIFLPWGLIIIFEHNLWIANWQVIITIFGWLVTLKCVLYLFFPSWTNFISRWSDQFLRRYLQVGGCVIAMLGAIILLFSYGLI